MLPLVLLLAVGLPLAETNLSWPQAETSLTWPLAETNLTWPQAETNLTWPLAETNLTWPQAETNLTWPLAETNLTDSRRWTYNLVCYDCAVVNTFTCGNVRTCVYHVRRCMTVSIRLNSRELLVYKNCTYNCTFLYPSEVPPEAPRKITRFTNFYYVRCCNSMRCNEGGPTNIERDVLPVQTLEEELPEGAVRLGASAFVLSLASITISNMLT